VADLAEAWDVRWCIGSWVRCACPGCAG